MHGREQGDADSRDQSRTPGIDAARIARIRAIERMPFDNFSDLDYDEARDASRSPDSPLPDSARTPAAAREHRQNRLPAHDSRRDAARRRAARSQISRAPSAPRRSRHPRRHLGLGPLRRAVDARIDGGCARMLPPRQQFRVRRSSGGGGFRAGPSRNDAGAGSLRALGLRPRARRAVAAPRLDCSRAARSS